MSEIKKKKLTLKKERFCQEYMIDLNGSQAAIRAGYSPNGINRRITRMLADEAVQEELKRLREEESVERKGRKQRYLEELERLALSDITKYEINLEEIEDPETKKIKMKIKVTVELGMEEVCSTAAVQEISMGKYGPKIKTHDKVTPLLKLIEREEKLEEIEGKKDSKDSDGFLEALNARASTIWADWSEEDGTQDSPV